MRLAAGPKTEWGQDNVVKGAQKLGGEGDIPNILYRTAKFHTSIHLSVLYGFGNLAILAIWFLWFNPLYLTGPWWVTVLTASFFLVPLPGLWQAYTAIRDRPVLSLSAEGIRHTNLGTGIVRWDEILLVEAGSEASAVILWLTNRKEVPDNVPESKFARNGAVVLDVEYFGKSCAEIMEAINLRLVAANPTCIAAKEQALHSRLATLERKKRIGESVPYE
ncbi:MAG: hypothetical protein EG825_14050 [Rhodocyclaceae bacterium]|nr:hypothetical protein [Rhodocyclaceae bacterium]